MNLKKIKPNFEDIKSSNEEMEKKNIPLKFEEFHNESLQIIKENKKNANNSVSSIQLKKFNKEREDILKNETPF